MALKFVCDVASMPVGMMAKFDIDGKPMVIYHLEDGFYATQHRCTHLFASLNKGKIIDGSKVRCWFHHAVFNIKTGKVVKWANFPPGIQAMNVIRRKKDLKTFQTKVENNNLYVEI
ncbi:MAG: Rieske (2Fe-2S) protein [Candidatus Anammoxibacter sp.]